MANYEKQALEYLKLPLMPKNLWDNKTHFDDGIAVVKTITGQLNCAICRYTEKDEQPIVKKVFGGEPFSGIEFIYPMPKYMESDITKMSFNDEDSELAMQALINERDAKINKSNVSDTDELDKNEWHTEVIHNRQEAVAWLKSKGVKGAMFKTDDALKMKIYSVLMNEKISQ